MPGKNVSLLDIPPGINRNSTRYATGRKWYNGNQVRWENDILVPIGGWVKIVTIMAMTQSIRRMHSWRDLLLNPWVAYGSADKLYAAAYVSGYYTYYDITPTGLGWNPGGISGFGRDFFGSGFFGYDGVASAPITTGSWSLDNFGKLLVGVHSQDRRLVSWDPASPGSATDPTTGTPLATPASPVAGAPADNLLVIATNEEHLMVLGGTNNPRKVQWCSRRVITDWTATESNSAGGFDLQSNGSIIAAVRVSGGILVLTDADIHIIEYVGPPNYYGRRKISDEGGIISKFAISPLQGGAVWLDHSNVWAYVGGAVTKLPCTVQTELFENSNFDNTDLIHLGINEEAQEVWFMYPQAGASSPDSYVALSYAQAPYWTFGRIGRTAWLNPVWQSKPIAAYGNVVYQHEEGMLNDGVSRADEIFVETGALENGEGEYNYWVDRIYPDFGADGPGQVGDPDAVRLTFFLQQSPEATKRQIGPLSLTNPKGYITTRFRARQMYIRIDQVTDAFWKLGKIRLRVKQAGLR